MGERNSFRKQLYRFLLFFYFFPQYINCSENTNNILTSEKGCRIGIEISATAKEVAAITKENSQKCFKQTDMKEN